MENTLTIILVSIFVLVIATWILSPRKKKTLSAKQAEEVKNKQKEWENAMLATLEKDKERITITDMRNLIVELGLPQTFLDMYDETCNDEILLREFHRDYTAPHAILSYLTKEQQNHYLIDRYKPILSYAHSTIFAYDTITKGFITYYIELMPDNPEYLTWDGLFIDEIIRWWEYEVSDKDILHIGKLFGLKYTKEILDSIYSTTDGNGFATSEKRDKWRSKMLDKINGRIVESG